MDVSQSGFDALSVHRTAPVGDPYVLGRWHKDRVSLRGFAQEIRVGLKSLLRRSTARRFLILGRARSGTTLLVSLLNAVAGIACDGEMLHYRLAAPALHLRLLARRSSAPAYGCKVLSYQLFEVQRLAAPGRFLRDLAQEGVRIIHLERGTLAQCLSLSIAQMEHRYVQHAPGGARGPVLLDPDRFVQQLRWNLALIEYERFILRGVPHFSLSYERDLERSGMHQATVDALCAHIGVASGPVAAGTQRMLDPRIGANVGNFDAVLAALRAAGYDYGRLAEGQA